jgi:hypothetical protein
MLLASNRENITGTVPSCKAGRLVDRRAMIRWIRWKHRIPAPTPAPGAFSVRNIAERYGVSPHVVYYWIDRGVVTAQQRKENRPYEIMLDDATDQRLQDWVATSYHMTPKGPRTLDGVHPREMSPVV